jgi:glycosyl-4,4'-diaponeurosporenoate acyltransferase
MRLFYLPTFWTVVIDFIAWFIIHLGVVFVLVRIPTEYFNPGHWLYRGRKWEKDGNIYIKIFKVKKWKERLPDGARFARGRIFPKKRLERRTEEYCRLFLRETCRAELTHWILILFAFPFFLWNKPGVGFFMIFYALAENLPLIIAQRYNRCRLRRILARGKANLAGSNDARSDD